MYLFTAVQHERAPRTYSKKPSYFSDFSAIAAGAAAVAAASNQVGPGSIPGGASVGVRPPLLNPLGIPHGMHPYYPLHHFKSFFPSLFPPATSAFYSPPQPPATTSPPSATASNMAFSPALTASSANEEKNICLTPSPPPPRAPSAPACPPPTSISNISDTKNDSAEEIDEDITDVVTDDDNVKSESKLENNKTVKENITEDQSSDDKGELVKSALQIQISSRETAAGPVCETK